MGIQDHAVVVGINTYPDLGSLTGPTNDALDFREWLLDPQGGNVPAAQVHVIVSQAYPHPPPLLDAKPQLQQVEDRLLRLFNDIRNSGGTANRLYLYFAGHGFSKDVDDAAILMANAARGSSTTLHIQGGEYAKVFAKASLFREVVLFMDCCREDFKLTNRRPPVIDDVGGGQPAELFYGYAAKWSRASREGPWGPNNIVRGIFTLTLLAGLRGGATRDANGQVSAIALNDYVVNTIKTAATGLQPGEEQQEPQLTPSSLAYLPNWKFNAPTGEAPSNVVPHDVLLVDSADRAEAPKQYTLTLPVQNGTTYQITASNDDVIAPAAQQPNAWTWTLSKGYYKVIRNDGVSHLFEAGGLKENLNDPF